MRKLLLSCLLLFMVFFAEARQSLSFYSEYIDFTVDDKYFSVNGIYQFCNNSGKPVKNTILFPFAVNVSYIDSISITNLESFETIAYRKGEQYLVFPITVMPYDSVDINVFYRQQVNTVNTYILRSTQIWGAPLKRAFYTLTADEGLKIKSFSMSPDTSTINSGQIIYYWNFYSFEPQKDFEIVIEK